MIGKTTMVLNVETMQAAVREFLERKIPGHTIKVLEVKEHKEGRGIYETTGTFQVEVEITQAAT